MSITTRSAFYYGHTITRLNNAIDFNEGGSELQATLNNGDYTLEEFLAEVQRALNAAGALSYTVSVNRTTRIMTIAASGTATILAATGSRIGTGAWTLMGYPATNVTGTSFPGTTGSGSEFLPQVIMYGYTPSDYFVEKNDAVVNESAGGLIQVVQFGTNKFIECDIRLNVNDGTIKACRQPEIEANATGLTTFVSFMNYGITKAKMEFMPDRATRSTFQKVLLESTERSKNGTAFKLNEIDKGPGYWDSGRLTFRVVT